MFTEQSVLHEVMSRYFDGLTPNARPITILIAMGSAFADPASLRTIRRIKKNDGAQHGPAICKSDIRDLPWNAIPETSLRRS
jgi:hypothetical protein